MTKNKCLLMPMLSLTLLGGTLLLTGCGGGAEKVETAPVSGTITKDGTPVTGGTVTFIPIAEKEGAKVGKPATGNVGSDGTYTLKTYEDGDGAAIGKHNVAYSPPAPEIATTEEGSPDESAHKESDAEASITYVVEPVQVEVKAESNKLDLKLVPQSN